ncbi:FbpB family small basic protein [Shouchella patagoniensis]|uniref:FbpB family small basic protein n=1 Tax=Bacillaceae TaxID=186817 RepID=UPI000AB82795|nr:FbpB family small basic protein [Shouchella patagoniensis]
MRKRHLVRYEDLIAQNRDELLNDPEALIKIDDKLYERAQKKNDPSKKTKNYRTSRF